MDLLFEKFLLGYKQFCIIVFSLFTVQNSNVELRKSKNSGQNLQNFGQNCDNNAAHHRNVYVHSDFYNSLMPTVGFCRNSKCKTLQF